VAIHFLFYKLENKMSFDDGSSSSTDMDYTSYFISTKKASQECAQVRIRLNNTDHDGRCQQSPPTEETAVSRFLNTVALRGGVPMMKQNLFNDRLSVIGPEKSNIGVVTFDSIDDTSIVSTNEAKSRHHVAVENIVRVIHGKQLREIAREMMSASIGSQSSTDSVTDNISSEERWTDTSSNASKLREDDIEIENMMHKVGNPPKPLSNHVQLFSQSNKAKISACQNGSRKSSESASSDQLRLDPRSDTQSIKSSKLEQNLPNQSFLQLRAILQMSDGCSCNKSLRGPETARKERAVMGLPAENLVISSKRPTGRHVNIANLSTLTSDGLSSSQPNIQLENVDYLSVMEVASDDRDLSTIESITSNEARAVFCRREETMETKLVCKDQNGRLLSSSRSEVGCEMDADEENLENQTVPREEVDTKPSSRYHRVVNCQNRFESFFLVLIAASTATLLILVALLVTRK
jgi:hypothetical protein